MSMPLFAPVIALVMLGVTSLVSYAEEPLEVLTEHWPPFNYTEEGELTGFGTEVVRGTLKEAGIDYVIREGIWKGVYERALNEKNIMIYTISRTEMREPLFEWIGPFSNREQNFFKLKSRDDIQINSLEDAKRYRVAVQEADAIAQDLLAWGFSEASGNLMMFSKRVLTYRMMFAGRVDLVTGQDIVVKHHLRLDGLPYEDVALAYKIAVKGGYYMAFSKGSDPALVERVRAGFKRFRASYDFSNLEHKYR